MALDANQSPTYLCWKCATARGLAREIDPAWILSTPYQLEKFVKHTVLDPLRPRVSIFSDPSVSAYKNWVVNAYASACVSYPTIGQWSYIFAAGKEVGVEYKNGSFHTVGDAVKVVLPSQPGKVHAYPVSSHFLAARTCSVCGAPVVE
jgi:hypothetical protein